MRENEGVAMAADEEILTETADAGDGDTLPLDIPGSRDDEADEDAGGGDTEPMPTGEHAQADMGETGEDGAADEEAEGTEETDSETETAPDGESGENPAEGEGGSPEKMTLPPIAIAFAVAIVAIIVAVAVMTAGVGMSSGRNAEASFPKAHVVTRGSGEATDDIHGKTQTPTHQNDPNYG